MSSSPRSTVLSDDREVSPVRPTAAVKQHDNASSRQIPSSLGTMNITGFCRTHNLVHIKLMYDVVL